MESLIDIAEGNDIFGEGGIVQIARALAAHADAGDIEFFGGRGIARAAQDVAGDDGDGGRNGSGGEKHTAGGFGGMRLLVVRD